MGLKEKMHLFQNNLLIENFNKVGPDSERIRRQPFGVRSYQKNSLPIFIENWGIFFDRIMSDCNSVYSATYVLINSKNDVDHKKK